MVEANVNKLTDNQYYSDAWKWYCDQYLKPITEQMWLMILLISSIVCLIIHVWSVYSFFPLKSSLPFAMYVDGNDDDIHIMNKITSSYSDIPQIALAEYLVRYYVKIREEYDYHNLETQAQYIRSNSSRVVYNDFTSYFNIHSNPDNPISKYKKDGKRTIKVVNIKIYGSGFGTNNAEVEFISSNNITNTTKRHSIMLRFVLSNIASVAKSVPLEFRVLSYGK